MPETQAQFRFAAMSASARGRAKLKEEGKKPMTQGAATEMRDSMKGRKVSSLPARARKK